MILEALNQYYETLVLEPDSGISPQGYSKVKVSFALKISSMGELLDIVDLRQQNGKRFIPVEMDVPEQVKRSSGIAPNFLCDNSSYVLGVGMDVNKKIEITVKKYNAFREHQKKLIGTSADEGLKAFVSFLDNWKPEMWESFPILSERIEDIAASNILITVDGCKGYIHQRQAAREAWSSYCSGNASSYRAQCLVTGKIEPIARLHQSIKGVMGAQSSGASLVSFNIKSSESYGKEQSFNAPVGEAASFAYTTTLSYLLRSDRQKIRIGDTTTVFWAEKSGKEIDLIAGLLNPSNEHTGDDEAEENGVPHSDTETVMLARDILSSIKEGNHITESLKGLEPDMRFYILGLAPNASRLSVRFWQEDTFGSLVERIGIHYRDLSIIRPPFAPENIPIWMMLKETAPLRDSKRIAPVLGGALMRSILTGGMYPAALYSAVLSRIRTDRDVNYVRAAMIKAYLARKYRINRNIQEEVICTMSLNEQSTNVAYRMGRLFALLEKIQSEAVPGIKTTIKDKYFGAASAAPGTVFPMLLRLAQQHIVKTDFGKAVDRQVEEVLMEIENFPAHLDLEQQGLFVLGYYHQRQSFYQKSQKKEG